MTFGKRQPQIPGNIFRRLNEDAASASHVDLKGLVSAATFFLNSRASRRLPETNYNSSQPKPTLQPKEL